MGFVVVISLPLILFAVLLGFGCYFFGKTKGRQEVLAGRACQVYGTPATPPGAAGGMSPAHEKKDAPDNPPSCTGPIMTRPSPAGRGGPIARRHGVSRAASKIRVRFLHSGTSGTQ
ncbi:hypothetical protein Taro_019851 [Colocasia esculenta]|uniref:Uncharacterized protein n=1 Tax=Colocasia esculenta TaxID=4460 RepID=A0A843V3E3_COLES|nr:hypothetical protein [Colocasia esculenta]